MRRYVASLCMLLCIHLVPYGKTDTCSEIKSGNLDCYSNYADRISCTWNKGSYPGNGSSLALIDDYTQETYGDCNLVYSTYDDRFHCDITGLVIVETDSYTIIVEDSSTGENLLTIEEFQPLCNIKLDPPTDLSYNFTGTVYNITWGGNSKFNGATRIHYELQLKKEASRLTVTKNITHDTYVEMMSSEFDEGANYIQIRCRTENQWDYKSHWSEWSSELKIQISEAEKGQKDNNIIDIITIVSILTLTVILLFLALFFNLYSRINVTFLKKIPTAADFFHPLYHLHNGNFQDWTKYPNKCKKDKSGIGQHFFPQDTDLYSTTVLYFHKEAVSPVKLESPLCKEGISLTHDTCDSMPCSGLLMEKEVSLDGMYPTFFGSFPGFSEEIMNEKDVVCSLDCTTDYFSYEGNYVSNSQEIAE